MFQFIVITKRKIKFFSKFPAECYSSLHDKFEFVVQFFQGTLLRGSKFESRKKLFDFMKNIFMPFISDDQMTQFYYEDIRGQPEVGFHP